MADKENLTRWLWDLFPLSKDSWGAWQLADDEHRPDQRVFVRRYQGDGYLGPPVSMDMLARMMEQGHTPEDFAQREGYVPTQDDLDLLKRQYPNSDPYQPVWRAIKSDLVAARHAIDSLQGYDVPALLGLLKRSETPDVPEDGETKTASPKKKAGRPTSDFKNDAELVTEWENPRAATTNDANTSLPIEGLQTADDTSNPSDQTKKAGKKRVGGLKQPSDDATTCYRAWFATGMPQQALASRMTKEFKRPVSQGQVSRWLKQVKEWINSDNVLSELPEQSRRQPVAVDPAVIDMGARVDGHTQRQRCRRSEDSDD